MSALQQALLASGGVGVLGGTWDPATKGTAVSLSGGNLIASWTSNTNGSVKGTVSRSGGAWSFDALLTGTAANNTAVGLANSSMNGNQTFLGADTAGVGWDVFDGHIYYNGSSIATTGTTATGGDRVTVVFNFASNTIFWRKNGVLVPSSTISIPVSGALFAAVSNNTTASTWTAIFT